MSMFHELMMRKKEEIMYATIKGSLTESPEGVFSGFSASNYLEIPKFNKNSKWEMVFCFTTPNSVDDMKGKGIIQENVTTTYKTRVNINSSGTGIAIFMSSTGDSFDIGSGGMANIIGANNKYFLKVEFTGTQYIWSLKSTGDYSIIATFNSSTTLRDSTYKLGIEANNGFTGSIDLNNSYIKLGSTKYNLQAVVGYTIVGSPTIVDGVVSGFSGSNYLTIPCFDREVALQNGFEATVEFTTSSIISSGQIFGLFFNGGYDGFRIGSNKDISYWFFGSNYVISSSANFLQENTTYVFRVVFQDNVLSLYCGEKGGSINLIGTKTYTSATLGTQKPINFGVSTSYSAPTDCSINIPKTSIKLNNKLWFNGQQA